MKKDIFIDIYIYTYTYIYIYIVYGSVPLIPQHLNGNPTDRQKLNPFPSCSESVLFSRWANVGREGSGWEAHMLPPHTYCLC